MLGVKPLRLLLTRHIWEGSQCVTGDIVIVEVNHNDPVVFFLEQKHEAQLRSRLTTIYITVCQYLPVAGCAFEWRVKWKQSVHHLQRPPFCTY